MDASDHRDLTDPPPVEAADLLLILLVPILAVAIGTLYASRRTRGILVGIGNVLSLLRPW